MGDSFLYAYLPINYKELGLSLFEVGVILSVNRFARLFLNSPLAYFSVAYGVKKTLLLSIAIATLTTLCYGFANSLVIWVLVRILWGACFSTLRLVSFAYALQSNKQGLALGVSKSITEVGTVIALLAGSYLATRFNHSTTFTLLAIPAAFALLPALKLPELQFSHNPAKEFLLNTPSLFNLQVFTNTFIVEGLVVILTARLLGNTYTSTEVITLAGLCLAYRRLSLIIFSPLSGWLADVFGFNTLFRWTSLLLILSISLLAISVILPGILLAFTSFSMNAAVSPAQSIKSGTFTLKEISVYAFWRDIGAAIGTVAGALLLDFLYLHVIFTIAVIPLIIFSLIDFIYSKRKLTYHEIR